MVAEPDQSVFRATGNDRMTHSLPDEPPMINAITPYDEAHFGVYLRLLDAKAAGVHWRVAIYPRIRSGEATGAFKADLASASNTRRVDDSTGL